MHRPDPVLLRPADPFDPDPARLVLVSPGQGPGTPSVLIFPGGGYHRRAPHEAELVGEYLASNGFGAAVAHYRVSPHRHPAPLADARRAIRRMRERALEWNLDPARIAVLGFSAGGHLAATLATQSEGDTDDDPLAARFSSRPDAVALAYPVISLVEHAHEGSVQALLGAGATPADRAALSAERNVGPTTPPAFLFHTADDPAVPVQNSLAFARACADHGIPCELHVFPHGRHGVGLAQDDPVLGQWPALLCAWLHRTLRPPMSVSQKA
jgi:acetyl esterase/lipase